MAENEKRLFARLAGDDREAFGELYRLISPRLLYVVNTYFSYLEKGAHKDILQEVFLILWEQRAAIAQMEHPIAFLEKCTRNKILDNFSDNQRKRALHARLSRRMFREDLDLERDLREFNEGVRQAVNSLSPRRQLVYRLCREQNRKLKDVALELGISEHTVRNTLYEAIALVIEHLNRINLIIGQLAFIIIIC